MEKVRSRSRAALLGSRIFLVTLVVAAASCRASAPNPVVQSEPVAPASVIGKVDYRELVLLPRGSLLRIQLAGVPAPDGAEPAEELLAVWEQVDPGQVPIDFTLGFDPAHVAREGEYRIRAWITQGERVLFQTTKLAAVDLWEGVQRQRALDGARWSAAAVATLALGLPPGPFLRGPAPSAAEADPPTSAPMRPQDIDVGTIRLTRAPKREVEPGSARVDLPERALVRGRLTFAAGATLPPDAVATVSLVGAARGEVDRIEAQGEVLAEWSRTGPGELPLEFELTYDPSQVSTDRGYALRARVDSGGELLFRRTALFPVALAAAVREMEEDSRAAGAPGPAPPLELGAVELTAVPRRRAPDAGENQERAPEAPTVPTAGSVVHGEVFYFEPGRLPGGAVMSVELVATGRAERDEVVLASSESRDPGEPPIPFALAFDPTRVDADHDYSIRVEITAGGRALYRTTRRFGVELWQAVERDAGDEAQPVSVEAGRIAVTRVPR